MAMLHGRTVLLYLIVGNNYECEVVKQEINVNKLLAINLYILRRYITMNMYELYLCHEIRLID